MYGERCEPRNEDTSPICEYIQVPLPRTHQIVRYTLLEAKFSHKPSESYEYDHSAINNPLEEPPNPLLTSKRLPNHRFQSVDYYKEGKCQLDSLKAIHISKKNDFRINRVKEIKGPVGSHRKPIVTHRFIYEKGRTEVYDANLHKTVYAYNEEHRLTEIVRFLKNQEIYSKEKFVWDEKEQKGNLLGKYIKESHGKIYNGLFFTYDSNGNITEESFYGNLSGTCAIPLTLNSEKKPLDNGVECYKKNFTYSKGSFNLLLSEQHDNGKKIVYSYVPKTNLVSAKYLMDENSIKSRQFFFYDEDNTLTKLIKDDGTNENHDDLCWVTTRTITHYVPRKTAPYGLPEQIIEMYWDMHEHREVLLKRVLCEYTLEGRLSKQHIFDANDQYCYTLYWEYDSHGNITREVNALSQEIIKCYDENNNLILEQRPQESIEYFYDYSNRLIKTVRHADGVIFSTHYSYDYSGNRTSMIDHFSQQTNYFYDEFNRLIKTEHPSVLLSDRIVSPVVEMTYDIQNNPTIITQADGLQTHLTYNARGKPITKTYPDGSQERFEYNLSGTLAKSIAPNGTYTLYKRDFLDRVIAEEVYDIDHHHLTTQTSSYQGARLVEKKDAEDCITAYGYDGAGRLISEVCGDSHKTFAYDSLGNIAKITDWFGQQPEECRVQTFHYDFLRQLIEENIEDSRGQILQGNRYEYDERGNKIRTYRKSNEGEICSSVEYNADNQPVKIIDPEGNVTHFSYHTNHRNSLDQRVLSIHKTDPKGRKTIQIHDALGRVCEVIRKDPFGKTIAKQEIFYDANGKRIKTIDAVIANGSQQREYVVEWRYHPNGQEEVITEAVGTPEQKITRFVYNGYGEKEKVIKPNGKIIHHTYDPLGRVSEIRSSDDSIAYSYTYNRCHQVTRVKDLITQTETTRSYDLNGNLLEETLGNGLTLNYLYDPIGRLTDFTLPDHSSVKYTYNAAYLKKIDRYQQKKVIYTHENLRHNHFGNIEEKRLIGQSGTIKYTYNALGQSKEIKSSYWSQINTTYDSLGHITHSLVEDNIGSTQYAYTYNNLDHLETESGQKANNYQTDSLQNRLEKNHVPYHINSLNQMIKQGNCQYEYDQNGNLTQKKEGENITCYSYDAFDRLIEVDSRLGKTSYQYDSFNRRLIKKHRGETSRFLYQGENEIGSVNEQGTIVELMIPGAGEKKEVGSAVALELYGKIMAPIHDRQGQIACLIDSITGLPVENYRYTAFGEETIFNEKGEIVNQSQVGNPWRFAGKRTDPETQWVYFGRRYYDSETGRWTTADPLSFADGPNLYAYLHHNPLNSYDAYGLYSQAYVDSCNASFSAREYHPLSNIDRSDMHSNNSERTSYLSGALNELHQTSAGVFHGCLNFVTSQYYDTLSFISRTACYAINDSEKREQLRAMIGVSFEEQHESFNHSVTNFIGADANNSAYQNCRYYTAMTFEVGSYALAGYGVARGAYGATRGIYGALSAGEKIIGASTQASRCTGQVFRHELGSVAKSGAKFDLDSLSKAGQVMDRSGLTRAGRALDKHGGRSNSAFPKATGNSANKNMQGQFHLDDIVTHPQSISCENRFGGQDVFSPSGRGVRFDGEGNFTGFLQPRRN